MAQPERRPGRLADDPCNRFVYDPDVECAAPETARALADKAWAAQAAGLLNRTPFYAGKYGLSAAEFAALTLDDLASLPLITKREIKEGQLAEPPFGTHL